MQNIGKNVNKRDAHYVSHELDRKLVGIDDITELKI